MANALITFLHAGDIQKMENFNANLTYFYLQETAGKHWISLCRKDNISFYFTFFPFTF